MKMENNQVNIIIEFPSVIDKTTRYMVTLKTEDEINTNVYSGDFVNTLVHTKIEEFFHLLGILDSFGFVELDASPEDS